MKGGVRLTTIMEVLKREKSMSDERVVSLVESAKSRLANGESPIDVLCDYYGEQKSEEDLLKLLPNES